MDSQQGVQVVKIDNDHSYHLNEEALKEILLKDDIRDHPVVVVSVAGAYRGGKSFLLDFFLRYLYSQESNRRSDQWLGAADEPLKGFSWRGGSERNTTGIVLWSQPIRVTLPSGETVVVLVMDTQGTFDSESTVRDCSTIFAISTLLSSVQIYNLSQNVKEDDLQHLQLFTEYGKLAANGELRPFQMMKFLVRDWPYPHEHPFGATGGQQLLNKRLQIHGQQPEELREIREHIHSCFDSVGCFLMPHPGFTVSDPKFNGRLSDLRHEFKESLMELVPSILEQQNLKPKLINGQRVTASGLLYYFKTYMEIFNSDTLPAPRTILKATAEAALLAAAEAARRHYRLLMDAVCDEQHAAVTRAKLRDMHQNALQDAQEVITSSKCMASQQDIDSHTRQLSQELDSQFPQYEMINNAKIQGALSTARRSYETHLEEVSRAELLCLHPQDLQDLHRVAVEAAMTVYQSSTTPPEIGEDEDKNNLLRDLSMRFEQLRHMNEMNNHAALSEARDHYLQCVESACGNQPCMSSQEMDRVHEQAVAQAFKVFKAKRNRQTEQSDDQHASQLSRDLNEKFSKFKIINENNNRTAIRGAMSFYNNYMLSICAPNLPCLHPEDLRIEHEGAKDRALNEFHSWRTDSDTQTEHQTILKEINDRYEELCLVNAANNELAVSTAFEVYLRKMSQLVETPWFLKLLLIVLTPILHAIAMSKLTSQHSNAKSMALDSFQSKRRPGGDYDSDEYLEKLLEMIQGYFRDTSERLLF